MGDYFQYFVSKDVFYVFQKNKNVKAHFVSSKRFLGIQNDVLIGHSAKQV